MPTQEPVPPRSVRRRPGLYWVLLGSLIIACSQDPARVERTAPPRLAVLGIDGATWDVIDPMIARGEMPHLSRLLERGYRADLVVAPPLASPVVWTTLATGRMPRPHNILDHVYPYREGPKRSLHSSLRKVPALWNIASHFQRRVAIIGYFATHPPDLVAGVMISDRAAQGLPGSVVPPALEAEVLQEVKRLRDPEVRNLVLRRYLPWDYDHRARQRPEDPFHRVARVAKGRLDAHPLHDEFVQRQGLRHAVDRPDLLMIYLRMPDQASHATWVYFEPSAFDEQPEEFDRQLLAGAIPTAYRSFDEYIGRLIPLLGDDVNLVLLSDHGFGPATGDWRIRREELMSLSGNHRPDGIFLAAGPDIEPGRGAGLHYLDVAPTLLALARLPISEELPGRVAERVLRPDSRIRQTQEVLPHYDEISWQRLTLADPMPVGSEEAETLDGLAALGYIDRGVEVETGTEGLDLGFWQVEPRLRHNALVGEVMAHYLRGDLRSVHEVIAMVAEKEPDFVRHLPRLVRNNVERWQSSFEHPLIEPATRDAFARAYPGRFYEPKGTSGESSEASVGTTD